MFKLQKVFGNVDVNKDLLLLLVVGGLYSLAISLSNTFVNVYLWKQTGEYIDLALYNLACVILQPITFIIAGRWAKKIDRVIVFRLGVTFLALFFLTVLMMGDIASKYLLLLGSLLGVGYGFYWLAFNVLTFEITEPESRDFFNGFLGIMTSTAGMIGPIVAGFVITRMVNNSGYKIIFSISLGLFFMAILLSFFLKRRPAHGRFLFITVYQERIKNKDWRLITNAHFFQGLREGTFIFIISVFVFVSTGSELALGTFGLVNSGVSFVAYFFAARFIKKNNRKLFILLGGLILYFSIYIILFDLSFRNLIIYGAVIACAYPMLLVPYSSLTFDVIGRTGNIKEARIEYIVVRELFLNLGRIVSILLFILSITIFNQEKSIPILLAIVGAGHACIYFFIRHIKLENTSGNIEESLESPKLEQNLVDNESGSP